VKLIDERTERMERREVRRGSAESKTRKLGGKFFDKILIGG
jgi:hypothetical protein